MLPPLNESTKLGTLNPDALTQPLFKEIKSVKYAYQQIAQLSSKVEALKQQNNRLHQKLDSMIDAKEPTPFCQFKKWENQFESRLKSRETELEDFEEYLSSFRLDSDPTFVEVNACKTRKPSFDPITLSLLVSNRQKGFFSRNDLQKQNSELGNLIAQQEYVLRLLKARLRLFEDFQSTNSIKQTIDALKQGATPASLAGPSPTRSVELRMKKKLLTNELKTLVAKRKELLQPIIDEKMEKRENRNRSRHAIKIQKLFRGFLVRQELRKKTLCAIKIQKIIRGYLTRLQTRLYFETDKMVQSRRKEYNSKYSTAAISEDSGADDEYDNEPDTHEITEVIVEDPYQNDGDENSNSQTNNTDIDSDTSKMASQSTLRDELPLLPL